MTTRFRGLNYLILITVALYWASGKTVDTAIGGPVYSMPTATAVGSYGPTASPYSVLGTPPVGAKYLLAVADPDHQVDDPNDTDNVLLH